MQKMKDEKENRMGDVTIQAEVEANGTQQELDELHNKVHTACPVYCMLTKAGVKINDKWTIVKKQS